MQDLLIPKTMSAWNYRRYRFPDFYRVQEHGRLTAVHISKHSPFSRRRLSQDHGRLSIVHVSKRSPFSRRRHSQDHGRLSIVHVSKRSPFSRRRHSQDHGRLSIVHWVLCGMWGVRVVCVCVCVCGMWYVYVVCGMWYVVLCCVFVCVDMVVRMCVLCVVEWLYYSKWIIIIRWALTLANFFRRFSVGKCVFLFHVQWKLTLFFGKTVTPQSGLLIFHRERDTFRNKIMEIVRDFDEKSYNNNGKPWKSSRILRVSPFFFIFLSLFIIFLHFFRFFFWHVLSGSFMFFHVLSRSFIFWHVLSFSLSLLGAQNPFFWASISLRFLFTILM